MRRLLSTRSTPSTAAVRLIHLLVYTSPLIHRSSSSLGFSSWLSRPLSQSLGTVRMTTTTTTTTSSNMVTEEAPYGTWESPITSKAITAGSVKLGGGLFVVRNTPTTTTTNHEEEEEEEKETLLWLEGRPQEGGRNVLCRYVNDGDDTTDVLQTHRMDLSPAGLNIRTRVHEYGGGSVVIAAANDDDAHRIFVSEFDTQQLCELRRRSKTTTTTITTHDTQDDEWSLVPIETKSPPGQYRYADGVYHDGFIYTVREDHGVDGKASPKDVQNTICALHVDKGHLTVVASGNDFYAAPRVFETVVDNDEEKEKDNDPPRLLAAYVTWNHPNMPWDATELHVMVIEQNKNSTDGDPKADAAVRVVEDVVIAGGVEGDDSIMQPLWHPTSGDLYYLSDESGYYNLYRAQQKKDGGGEDGLLLFHPPTRVWELDKDLGGAAPGWVFGQQGFTFLPDGRLAAVYQKEGASVLVLATVDGVETISNVQEFGMDDGLPMMLGGLTPGTDSNSTDLYFMGGSPSTPTSLYRWNYETRGPATLLICSSTTPNGYDEGLISVPRQIEFPTTNGRTAFGYYYAPKNHKYHCTTEPQGPPLLVKAHGGPTACTGTSFNPAIQFWTSRGFAILDVDYGGSTGYGKEYRRRLRRSWGIVDIDDVCHGAQYLVQQGLADGQRLCIDGGSAGGFTTLGALAFTDVFSAGCSLYGVSDLSVLAGDTHKFESRYLDGLVGPYPEEEAIYKERSPIESVDRLSCPILLLHGDEDKIVPPNQAELMHAALLTKGIPTCLKLYQGEQHGFRKAEHIEDALDSELAFFGRVFGIPIPGAIDLDIDNLEKKPE